MPACKNCKFWLASDLKPQGFCRRFPPQVTESVRSVLSSEQVFETFSTPETAFPITGELQWCGEFLAKPKVRK